MNKKKRTILFTCCVLSFIVLTPAIVLYSTGYRFDFKTKQITQTGGFYFRIHPKKVDIHINGRLVKETDLLFGTALIGNILPQSYRVSVNKEGYISWGKLLNIEPQKVTEAKNITLVPENIASIKLNDDSTRLHKSLKGNRIILEKYQNNQEYLAFFDRTSNQEEVILKEEFFGEKQIDIYQIIFSNNEQLALVKTTSDVLNSEKYYLLDYRINNRLLITPTAETVANIPHNAVNIKFDPNNERQLLFINNGLLLKTIIGEKSTEIKKEIKTFTLNGKDLYYLDNRGFVYKSDVNISYNDRINNNPFFLNENSAYEIYSYGDSLMIKENESLFKFSQNNGRFEKIFNQVSEIRISPDSKKLAIISGSEIWVLYLIDSTDAPYKKSGDLVFLTRLSGQTKSIYWYTSHYLIFASGDVVKIIEIDDRDIINIAEPSFYYKSNNQSIAQVNIDIIFDERTQRLYLLSNNALYLTEKIVN